MRKPTQTACLALLLCLLGAWLTASAAFAEQARQVTSSDDERLSLLAFVLALHRLDSSSSVSEIKIFEIGGGDPAMNGAFIYVCIQHNEQSRAWKTGLNVRRVDSVRLAPNNTIIVNVREDIMDNKASIVSRKATYCIRFGLDGDVLQNIITVEKR